MSLKGSRSETANGDSTGAGLEPTRQVPASGIECVQIGEKTVTELWTELLSQQEVRDVFVRAARELCNDRTLSELYDTLEALDVPYLVHGAIESIGRGHRKIAWEFVSETLPALGTNTETENLLGAARLCEFVDTASTLPLKIDKSAFETLRREQRQKVCELIATLSKGFDVRLISSRLTRAWLRHNHRESLPGVSEWCSTTRGSSSIDAALEALDVDGRETQLLRTLREEPTGTLAYSELASVACVSDSRVRQCAMSLSEFGLVEKFNTNGQTKLSLLEAGREFLSEIDAKHGQQKTLEAALAEPQKHTYSNRVTPTASGQVGKDGQNYRTRWMDRPLHHATVASSGETNNMVLVDGELGGIDAKSRLVSYDEPRAEAVVSVQAGSPMQYVVSSAIALASPRFLDTVLPTTELASIVDDEPDAILRGARCIGWLSEEALDDAQTLRDRLVSAGEELEELTYKLRSGDTEDTTGLCGAIFRLAHGLAGTVAHLLDHADVTLYRDVRVPGGISNDKLGELAQTLVQSATIQSHYGSFSVYRQLFEDRSDKRQSAFSVDVDATEPLGNLIGEFVLRGPDVQRLRSYLQTEFEELEVHNDAPEIAVPIALKSVGRPAYAQAATRTLRDKNIKPTREAVTILHALAETPQAATYALYQLGKEDTPRELRADELRYALAHLDGERILSELSRSVGKIVATLLEATEPLTQTELAERADVSTQTIRNNRDALEAVDIVRVDGTEWRVALSFSTKEERRSGIVPALVSEGAVFRDVLSEFLHQILPPERYGDPSDPVAGAVFHPPEPWVLLEHDELAGWVKLIARLTETEIPETEQGSAVTVGPQLQQQPIQQTSPAVAD